MNLQNIKKFKSLLQWDTKSNFSFLIEQEYDILHRALQKYVTRGFMSKLNPIVS